VDTVDLRDGFHLDNDRVLDEQIEAIRARELHVPIDE
jgi:hypothetical protein